MSYGFEVINSSGILVANSTDFGFGLVSSGSVTIANNGNSDLTSSPTGISFTNTVEIPLIFIKNNSSSWITLNSVSTTSAAFYAWASVAGSFGVRSATTATIEYRVFAPFNGLGSVSGQNYGIQIFDASGNKTFDSNYVLPLIANTGTITVPGATDSNGGPENFITLPSGVGSDPWYNITAFGTGYAGQHWNAGLPNRRRTLKCSRIFSGQLQLSYGHLETPTGFNSTDNWHSGVTVPVLFINSQTSTPLAATASFVSGSTSCSYFSGSQSNCTTTATYKVDYTGGNTNTVNYSWSLINNTGGFSFSGGTTGQTATITKTGTGTSTYTATLRCTVSQTGSTSVNADTAISYTHTSVPPGVLTVGSPSSSQANNCSTIAVGQTAAAGIVSNLTLTLSDTKLQPTAAQAGMTFNTNGTINLSGTNSTGGSNWYTPTTTNIGNNYWVKVTLNSGQTNWTTSTPASMTSGTVYAMNTTRTFTWRRTTLGTTTSSGTIQFYTDPSGNNPVGSGSTFSVSVTVDL